MVLNVDPNNTPDARPIVEACAKAGIYVVTWWNKPADLHPWDFNPYYISHIEFDGMTNGAFIADALFRRHCRLARERAIAEIIPARIPSCRRSCRRNGSTRPAPAAGASGLGPSAGPGVGPVSGAAPEATCELPSGRPMGPTMDATPRPLPARVRIDGRYCRLEPLHARHAPELWRAAETGSAAGG